MGRIQKFIHLLLSSQKVAFKIDLDKKGKFVIYATERIVQTFFGARAEKTCAKKCVAHVRRMRVKKTRVCCLIRSNMGYHDDKGGVTGKK